MSQKDAKNGSRCAVLLTFTGFHDPYPKGLIGEEERRGPVLSLVAARSFDAVVLLSTPATERITEETAAELEKLSPRVQIQVLEVPLTDPTDYRAILSFLRARFNDVSAAFPEAEFFVAVASGTPQMHASWVLLVSSGEIPAKILHVRPPRFITKDAQAVSEVDLTADEFPSVRARPTAPADFRQDLVPDLNRALMQLQLVGDHPAFVHALEVASTLADSMVPMLVRGETGTGKELFARLVHLMSGRTSERFVVVNCAALPTDLVESLLFGHTKGAFTGATQDQQGKFVAASR